jgi:type II secretory pathway component PulF
VEGDPGVRDDVRERGAGAAAPTRFVIGLSRFINGYWWAVLGGAAAAVFLVRNYYATQAASW